jgi:hypothetical protein
MMNHNLTQAPLTIDQCLMNLWFQSLMERMNVDHCKPAPTSAPWRMNGKWSGNSFWLGSSFLANHGGELSCFFFSTLLLQAGC